MVSIENIIFYLKESVNKFILYIPSIYVFPIFLMSLIITITFEFLIVKNIEFKKLYFLIFITKIPYFFFKLFDKYIFIIGVLYIIFIKIKYKENLKNILILVILLLEGILVLINLFIISFLGYII